MEAGEGIVYLSVWAALFCYPAAAIGHGSEQPSIRRWARWTWSAGCLAFGLHVVTAFGVFYGWSHSVALAETARQTLESTGVDSSAGLYLNYLFALLWTVDAVWWWCGPESYHRRPRGLFLAIHGFFLFMIVNGAVIFVSGPRRGLGALVTVAGLSAVIWTISRDRQRQRGTDP